MLVLMVGEAQGMLGGAQQAARARGRGGTPRHFPRPGRERPPPPTHQTTPPPTPGTHPCRLYGEGCCSGDG
jgi:hypothetical protein